MDRRVTDTGALVMRKSKEMDSNIAVICDSLLADFAASPVKIKEN